MLVPPSRRLFGVFGMGGGGGSSSNATNLSRSRNDAKFLEQLRAGAGHVGIAIFSAFDHARLK